MDFELHISPDGGASSGDTIMHCFSIPAIAHFFVWLVVVIAVVSIILLLWRTLSPKLGGWLGEAASVVGQIVYIVVWAVVIIFIIYFAFDLIECLVGSVH